MTNLTVSSHLIRSNDDDLYSLSDLHIAAGGDKVHHPDVFLDTPLAQAWVHDFEERQGESFIAISPLKAGSDSPQPVFVCRELAQAYALWVSSEFAPPCWRRSFCPRLNPSRYSSKGRG